MHDQNIDDIIRQQHMDTRSAQAWAKAGKTEEWVHRYLLAGAWENPELSDGLKLAQRWWLGPIELPLSALTPAVGPEPEREWVADPAEWYPRIAALAENFSDSLALPPLIIEYRNGELSIRDGNKRYGAMQLLGWETCWAFIWYNSLQDYRKHVKSLRAS
jgi:hypothetical protein